MYVYLSSDLNTNSLLRVCQLGRSLQESWRPRTDSIDRLTSATACRPRQPHLRDGTMASSDSHASSKMTLQGEAEERNTAYIVSVSACCRQRSGRLLTMSIYDHCQDEKDDSETGPDILTWSFPSPEVSIRSSGLCCRLRFLRRCQRSLRILRVSKRLRCLCPPAVIS